MVVVCKMLRCKIYLLLATFIVMLVVRMNKQTTTSKLLTMAGKHFVPEVVTYLVTTNSANNATKCRYSGKQIHQISFSKCHKEFLFTFMKFQMYIAPQTSPEKNIL